MTALDSFETLVKPTLRSGSQTRQHETKSKLVIRGAFYSHSLPIQRSTSVEVTPELPVETVANGGLRSRDSHLATRFRSASLGSARLMSPRVGAFTV